MGHLYIKGDAILAPAFRGWPQSLYLPPVSTWVPLRVRQETLRFTPRTWDWTLHLHIRTHSQNSHSILAYPEYGRGIRGSNWQSTQERAHKTVPLTYSEPVFFVAKKDGTMRLLTDYFSFNSSTNKKKYPLPLIKDLADDLACAKFFLKIGLTAGYNHVCVK